MKGIGLMDKSVELGCSALLLMKFMKAIGSKTRQQISASSDNLALMLMVQEVNHQLLKNKMAKASKFGAMAAIIMATSKKVSKKEKESISGQMGANTLDNG